MLTHYVKVVIGKKTIYLEKAQYVYAGAVKSQSRSCIAPDAVTFLSGYQVNKEGDAVIIKGAVQLHLIQLGNNGPKVYIQAFNPTYCELENADPASGRWASGVSAKKARLH